MVNTGIDHSSAARATHGRRIFYDKGFLLACVNTLAMALD
jgi:hypothetical protein